MTICMIILLTLQDNIIPNPYEYMRWSSDSVPKNEPSKGFRSAQEMIEMILWQNEDTIAALLQSSDHPSWYPSIPDPNNDPDTFLTHSFRIINMPVQIVDYEMERLQLIDLERTILGNLIVYQNEISIITGKIQKEKYLYPIISKRKWYLITMLAKENGEKILLTVSVFNNHAVVRRLLADISSLRVTNMAALNKVKAYLEEKYPITK